MGNISAAISRQRQQSETKNTYNPDLEYTQQGYADALFGRGAPTGSYGMTGGQYPTANKDAPGFGTGTYGYPGQYKYPGYVTTGHGDNAGQFIAGGNTGQPGAGNIYPGGGVPAGGAGGGGYQFGPGGGGQGYGGYSAMGQQPGGGGYQFGSEGATGDINATGAAAYGGYGQTYGGYQGLGRQYAQMGRQGVTQAERANLMAASNEPIQAQLASSRDIVGNRIAQSGNTAGALSAQARLGAQAGQALSSADRQNQIAILQENQRRKEAGLAGQAGALGGQLGATQGQAGLYGTGTGYASNLLAGRARLASLQQRGYTQGAGTGGTVSYSYGGGGGMGGMGGG